MDEINRFRQNFFDTVIEIEQKKEQEEKLVQSKCFHTYTIIGNTYSGTYQHRTCSKCGHSAVRTLKVWNGTKCVIS